MNEDSLQQVAIATFEALSNDERKDVANYRAVSAETDADLASRFCSEDVAEIAERVVRLADEWH